MIDDSDRFQSQRAVRLYATMVAKVQFAGRLWRNLGPRWLAFRAGYAFQQRTGQLRRRTPIRAWSDMSLDEFVAPMDMTTPDAYWRYRRQEAPAFFFAIDDREHYAHQLRIWDELADSSPQKLADDLGAGHWPFFEHLNLEVGFPPDWSLNALSGERVPSARHWSQLPDFGFGDIKVIWEPSRFGFTFALVRAYWRTGAERYAEIFWQLVEDWHRQNPPNQGPNWKCGQETTFRVMAWAFGLYGFLDAKATTPPRVSMLAQMIAVSGQRIEANLAYAISQRNNHGISEGVGLWTIGLLFPEFHQADEWRRRGQEVLEALGRDLIYDDGAFAQHSVNYHRLMLHDYLWALRLGEIHNQPFSRELSQRVASAGELLYQIQDIETGKVPYYGQNDGAMILPLSNCDYQDYRPVVQAIHYLNTDRRQYESGPWDEDLLWLFGLDSLSASVDATPRTDLRAEVGGYFTLRSQSGFAFTRCASYRDRPGQADMLHFDLWWRGQNVATDAGTYSYNAPPPWNNPLASTAYHNTVTVDGQDQMDRAGKFLWLPWLRSQKTQDCRSCKGYLAYWEGSHSGYQRLQDPVTHRRGILRIADDSWLVLDDLHGKMRHDYRLHWLFPDWPYVWRAEDGQLNLQTPAGAYYVQVKSMPGVAKESIMVADRDTPRGWCAPYYSAQAAAISLAMNMRADTALYATLFSPQKARLVFEESALQLDVGSLQLRVKLAPDGSRVIVSTVVLGGEIEDRLDID